MLSFSSKKKKEKSDDKTLKKEKNGKHKQNKKIIKNHKRNHRDDKHVRGTSYHDYEIDDHVTPMQFEPELRYSGHIHRGKKQKHNNNSSSHKQGKYWKNYRKTSATPEAKPSTYANKMSKNVPNLQISAAVTGHRKHTASQSTPTMPTTQAIFEEKEYDAAIDATPSPPAVLKRKTSEVRRFQYRHDPSQQHQHEFTATTTTTRTVTKSPSNTVTVTDNNKATSPGRDCETSEYNSRLSRISRQSIMSLNSKEEADEERSRSTVSDSSDKSRSSVMASSTDVDKYYEDDDNMDIINHVSTQMSNGDVNALAIELGRKGRRLTLERELNPSPLPDNADDGSKGDNENHSNNTNTNTNNKKQRHQYTRTYDVNFLQQQQKQQKQKSEKVLNRRTSAVLSHHLQLLTTNSKDGGSASAMSASAMSASASTPKSGRTPKAYRARRSSSSNKKLSGDGSGTKLPLSALVQSQQKHKQKKASGGSQTPTFDATNNRLDINRHFAPFGQSLSARVTPKQTDDAHDELGIINGHGNGNGSSNGNSKLSKKRRSDLKSMAVLGLSSSFIVDHSNSSKKQKKKNKPNIYGKGGYGSNVESDYDDEGNIPEHLRAYFAIQRDLNRMRVSTKKNAKKTQLDAINFQLHTLFFANERTNLPNLTAFQKFFLDRMSAQSVHKDLDWHICLLRPKIHSRVQHAQIDAIISMVADLLRKCVKKFNNKRGHLISAANTSRIGVGTYGGGKDKNQIQSAFILSKKTSSVPPELGRRLQSGTDSHFKSTSEMSDIDNASDLDSAYGSDSELSTQHHAGEHSSHDLLSTYDVMAPPSSVQLKQEAKKQKKKKQKHTRLLSFGSKKRRNKQQQQQQQEHQNQNEKEASLPHHHVNELSQPNMSQQEIVALTGLPGQKKAKGSDHHNVDEPYPMELFHISDMDFVLVYYVKFLTKFERIMVEFLSLYQQYSSLSDDMEADVALQLSLVASNPRETYLESMVKAQNTMQWGRQSREHPWIKVQTDKRKSQKFGQDLIYMVKLMKANDIEALHELMKQAPDLNTVDRETGKTVLQIALDKSLTQPSFAWVARFLALKQLLFAQRLTDESVLIEALETNNPMVAEILLHLEPQLDCQNDAKKTSIDLALHANYRNLARYMLKLHVPAWHTTNLMKRWQSACSTGDVVKLRSVLQHGFNVDYFGIDKQQKTALIICTELRFSECVEFLLKHKANVNAQDSVQRTALHYAAINLDGELFRTLMEKRANWTLRDLEGKAPIKYVMEKIGFVARRKAVQVAAFQFQGSNVIPENDEYHDATPLTMTATTMLQTQSSRFRGGSSANVDSKFFTYHEVHRPSQNMTEMNASSRRSSASSRTSNATSVMSPKDMYAREAKHKFWRTNPEEFENDSNASHDEYDYLVESLQSPKTKDDERDSDVENNNNNNNNSGNDDDDSNDDDDDDTKSNADVNRVRYVDVDVHQVVKILDIACQAGIPLNSRLFLLSVQRDWPHVLLVLCQAKRKLNIDITGRDGITPLMLAAREGKKACLSALLQSGHPDLDKADTADRTPIMHAAYRGEAECVARLLKAGASTDVETVDGTTLLMAACYGGLDEFAKYLCEHGAEVNAVNENGFSPLLFASSEGYQDVVNVLLNHNASIEVESRGGLTPLMSGCSGGLHEMVLYVLARINRSDMDKKDENGWTALMHAVACGHEKCAAILLKAGASVVSVGDDGYSLLSIAIMSNLTWMVRHILDVIRKQITLDNKKEIFTMFNTRETTNGFSCIHEACGIGADKCLSLLLEYNDKYFDGNMLRFNLPDLNGRTPLMIACLNAHVQCIQLLMDSKLTAHDIQRTDNAGHSLLIYGIESGDLQIMRMLIQHPIRQKQYKLGMLRMAIGVCQQRGYVQITNMFQRLNAGDTVTVTGSDAEEMGSQDEEEEDDDDDDDEYTDNLR
eukprot:CAMPEP_0202692844 /NCGR_PEP_ID=MMETSP1385-20130828/7122_1 /ASSEMBLY_ACC=CAM_ASM_000861 /TAXON_ID=933848 /ORGANISM="Elphidium margaritaceum" /LENGTH=1923 /DNA_ID=CAMNT_0049348441 /DNA_START=155 /DNA_END=5926 /DNA_ORIENTATION=+